MLRWMFPRQPVFQEHFEKAAGVVLSGANAFHGMVSDYRDIELKARQIHSLENDGDRITHDTIDLLNKTFITPIDREDIHELISKLDDVLDLIDAAAHRMVLYGVARPTPELVAIAAQMVKPVEAVKRALALLGSMKRAREILEICIEIKRLEEEADALHRIAIVNLFEKERDPIQVLKLKEIYEILEHASDRCEDVANVIEGIVIKNS
jgi:predicted phosphate transport protein (TIGR00153 family)